MTREDLLRLIREVFPDLVWPKDKLATVHSSHDLDCRYVVKHYQGKRWSEIAREVGAVVPDGWAFSQEALAFFLPAWLCLDLLEVGEVQLVGALAPYIDLPAVQLLSATQRKVAHDSLEAIYGGWRSWDNEDPVQRLIYNLSSTMTITEMPRGRMIIGDVEEVRAFLNQEWREMPHQNKADLFVELMRLWRPDAPGLDRTA